MRDFTAVQSILQNIIHHSGGKTVLFINIALGEIAEFQRDSIQSHWNKLSKDTLAEHAQLYFRLITAEVQCMACFKKYHPEGGEIRCPYCGSYGAKILSGEEFYIESIETEIK